MSGRNVNQPAAIFTAVMLSVAGTAMFMIQPIYLGALADEFGWSGTQIGNIAAAELFGAALAGLIAVFWIRRVNWRTGAIVTLCFTLAGNLVSCQLTEFESLLAVRFLTGLLGQGSVYAIALAAISDTRQADRNFGFGVMGQVTFGSLGLIAFPMLIPQWGVVGIFMPVCVLAGLCLLAVPWLPARGERGAPSSNPTRTFPTWLVFSVLGLQILWYVGIGGVWAFIERLGVDSGLDSIAVGRALAFGMVLGLGGAFASALLADRFGRILPFTAALLIQLTALRFFSNMDNWWAFAIPVVLYNVGWNFALPYLLGLLSKTDSSGRFAVLLPTAQAVGVTIGPALAGMLIAAHGVPVILIQGAVTCLLTMIIFVPLARRAS